MNTELIRVVVLNESMNDYLGPWGAFGNIWRHF